MSFTNNLDNLMTEKGINKSTLAKESGIPYTTIAGFYAKGTDNVKLSTLRKLSSYFDCSIDYLVDNHTSTSSATLTLQFDKTEYTKEQLDRIKAFAAFIKSEYNK